MAEVTTAFLGMIFSPSTMATGEERHTTHGDQIAPTMESACQNCSSVNGSAGAVVTPYTVPMNSNMPYWECMSSRWFFIVTLPIFLVFGVFGNTMSFCIMMRMRMRKSSVCTYLAGIAIADNIIFILQCLRSLMLNITFASWDLRGKMRCGLYQFLFQLSSEMSTVLITIVTFERLIAIFNPLKAPLWFTVRRARICLLVVFLVLAAWNLPLLLVYQTITHKGIVYCTADVPDWYYTAYNIVDAVIYSYGPFLCIMVSNLVLVCKLTRRSQIMKRTTARADDEVGSSVGDGVSMVSIGGQLGSSTARLSPQVPTTPLSLRAHGKGFANSVNDKILPMLIVMSTAFLVTTGPISIMAVLRVIGVPIVINMEEEGHCLAMLGFALPIALMVSNHGINFYLYCVSGKRFRSEFCSMLGINKQGTGTHSKTTSLASPADAKY